MGMDCWTLRGMVNLSCSLLLAAMRDLIKVVTPLSVQHIVVEILGGKAPLPGAQYLRLDEGPQERSRVRPL